MACPFIDTSIPDPRFNKLMHYETDEGTDYIFYDHYAGSGKATYVQFCQWAGRKRDVFQCCNETEWRRCFHYRIHAAQNSMKPTPDRAAV